MNDLKKVGEDDEGLRGRMKIRLEKNGDILRIVRSKRRRGEFRVGLLMKVWNG